MQTAKLLANLKDSLTEQWTQAVFASYPEKSLPFLKNQSDPFANPVASMIREAAVTLLDALAGQDVDVEKVKTALDRFVKIRAVQEFTPSQAVGVIYLLKPLLRQELLPQMQKQLDSYLEVESRLDSLALLAFDMYMTDKERVAEIRVTEIRNQYAQLKRWAQHLNAQAPLGEFAGCGQS
ncbi:MAG: RsbRD N-terminal domain-containing protein [Desulfovibrio sp.]|nr:RsbRD N-terminal domain-containing protein [Desulfovibrio sp.]